MPLDKQIVDLKISAGMDELSDPYLSTRPVAMQNVRYARTGALTKRRGSTTIGLTNGNRLVRSNYIYAAVGEPEAIYSHRGALTLLRGRALDLVQPVGASSNLYKIDFVPRQIGNPTVVTKDLNYGGDNLNGATTLKVVVSGVTYYGLAFVRRGATTSELFFALFSADLANLFLGTVDQGTLPTGPLNPRLAWNGAAGIVITYGYGSSTNRFVTFNIPTLTLSGSAGIPSIVGRFLTEDYAIQYDDAVNMTRIFYYSASPGQMTLDTVDPITLVRNNTVVVASLANFATATGVHVGMQIQQYIGLTWGDSQASAGTVFGALRTRAVVPVQQFAPQPIWSVPGDLILQVGTYYDRIHPTINTFEDAQLFCALVKKPSGQILHIWRMYEQFGVAQYPTQEIGSNGWIAQPGPSSVPILPEMDASPAVYFKAMRSYDGAPYYKIDGIVGLNIILSATPDAIGAYSQGYEGVFAFRGYGDDVGIVRPRISAPPVIDTYTGLMSGGMTSVFDGANVVESAPFGAPLLSKFAAAQGTGGVLQLLMTYGYAFIYSHTDSVGRKYRSQITYSLPLALVGTNNAFVLTVPAAYMGNARNRKVIVEIYRTVGNGATFYFLNQVDVVPYGTTVYSDGAANPITDSVLATREILYNTDGSDQAITGPACDSLAYSNGRVWCVGTGDNRVYFTSDVTDGDEPRFTASFSFPVLSNTPIVAAAQLDTSTILMSSTELFRISGDGPALAPSGGGVFSPPQPIASEDGCFSPRSVITLDEGVAYQSKAGIKLLSRGGQVVDYGADIGPALGIDSITHLIGKALWPVNVPELEEVRWLAQTNSAITHVVTDRYLSRTSQRPVWYTYLFSQPTGASEVVAQCMHNNFPTWVTANGYVYRDDPTSFLDNADSLTSLWVTADVTLEQWRPQSVNGFMRIWKVALLAERKSPHDLTFRQFYNFSTSAGSTLTWTSSEIAALDRESLQVRCKFQRLNGIQVRITDATPSTGGTIGTGEGLSIKGISLELGIDKGVVRRPAASQK